jgi:hypothetical protein
VGLVLQVFMGLVDRVQREEQQSASSWPGIVGAFGSGFTIVVLLLCNAHAALQAKIRNNAAFNAVVTEQTISWSAASCF